MSDPEMRNIHKSHSAEVLEWDDIELEKTLGKLFLEIFIAIKNHINLYDEIL